MTNYVIVEVTCQACGKTTAKLSAASWDAHTSCPTCRRECESVYLGHGFSSDHSLEAMHDDRGGIVDRFADPDDCCEDEICADERNI